MSERYNKHTAKHANKNIAEPNEKATPNYYEPKVHLFDEVRLTACHKDFMGILTTSDPLDVTCGSCKRTKVFRAALPPQK